jgi:hypothetical protein
MTKRKVSPPTEASKQQVEVSDEESLGLDFTVPANLQDHLGLSNGQIRILINAVTDYLATVAEHNMLLSSTTNQVIDKKLLVALLETTTLSALVLYRKAQLTLELQKQKDMSIAASDVAVVPKISSYLYIYQKLTSLADDTAIGLAMDHNGIVKTLQALSPLQGSPVTYDPESNRVRHTQLAPESPVVGLAAEHAINYLQQWLARLEISIAMTDTNVEVGNA